MSDLVHMDASGCVCPAASKDGVRRKTVRAGDSPAELWAACAGAPQPYVVGCNHVLLQPHESAVFPLSGVQKYSADDVHMHVRSRAPAPHGEKVSGPWSEVPLTPCRCD